MRAPQGAFFISGRPSNEKLPPRRARCASLLPPKGAFFISGRPSNEKGAFRRLFSSNADAIAQPWAQESRSVTMRFRTGASGVESFRSAMK